MSVVAVCEKPVVAVPTEVHPLLVVSPVRAGAGAGIHGDFSAVYQLSHKKNIGRTVRFMAVCTGKNITAARPGLVRRKDIRTGIGSNALSVFFCIPVECIDVPSKWSAVNSVRIIVTVCAE